MELQTTTTQILSNSIQVTTPPMVNGIYFLILNDEIVYIGSSSNCTHRLSTHRRERNIVFNRYHVLNKPSTKGRYLVSLEAAYIRHYKPRFNRTFNPDYLEGKKLLWFTFLKNFNSFAEVSRLTGVTVSTVRLIILEKRLVKDEVYKKVCDLIMNYSTHKEAS